MGKVYTKRPAAKFRSARLVWDYFEKVFSVLPQGKLFSVDYVSELGYWRAHFVGLRRQYFYEKLSRIEQYLREKTEND